MKVAIIADIHDNAHNLVLAMEKINTLGVEKVLFLGDFAGAAIAKLLCSSPVPVFGIWGNNDGDKCLITKFSLEKDSNLEVGFTVFDSIEVGGKKLFLSHYPMLGKSMAKSGDFDAVFYGHNHLKHKEMVGDCLLMNPGEISGYKTNEPSFAVYDSETNSAEFISFSGITTNTEVSKAKFTDIKYEFNKQRGHRI
tara:strand:+ start:251 stop:835 length:585 start_codon:yes stop_codon:yes gene_type:complete